MARVRSTRARASIPPRPRRRWPIAAAAALVLLAALGAWLWRRADTFVLEPRGDRNVLLVSIDTLRADALRSYGGKADTPALDRLAAQGARFTFAHAHAVLTFPSHASIFTGRYPYEHGVRDNTGYRMRPGEVTLANRLKTLGFSTGAFVGAFPLDQRFGLNAGFDVYDDRVGEVGTTVDFALPERPGTAVVASALDWIGRQTSKWFGFVHVFEPHAPYRPPAEYAARYPGDAYAGEVAWTDALLAPLLDRLGRESRPTLVIVTADHGESLGEHGEATHGIFAYEATLRVPLIIAEIQPGGGRPPAGLVIDAPVRHVDLVPTVLEAVGASAEPALAGASLGGVIRGDAGDRPSYFEAMMPTLSRGWAPLRGVLADRDKYIDLPIPELYRLPSDPGEQRNLVAGERNRADVLLNTLRTFDVSPPGRPGEETAAAMERLRALGYVSGPPAPMRERYTENDDPKRLIDLDQMMHRAGGLYGSGQLREAAELFREVIARRPDTADAYRYLAFVFWQAGQPDLAIATLEEALRRGVTNRDVRVKLGLYLAESGAAARAIGLLESMPQDDSEVLNALGIAYGQAGRDADALRIFGRALEIDQTSGLAYQNIATLHLKAGDLKSAEASLRTALDIDAALPGAHTALGVVLARTGRRDQAIDEWKRAVDLEATEFNALYNLTVELAAAGRRDEARVYGERYLATAPPALFASDLARIRQLLGSARIR